MLLRRIDALLLRIERASAWYPNCVPRIRNLHAMCGLFAALVLCVLVISVSRNPMASWWLGGCIDMAKVDDEEQERRDCPRGRGKKHTSSGFWCFGPGIDVTDAGPKSRENFAKWVPSLSL